MSKQGISNEEVQRVATLGRLRLTDGEVAQATQDVSGILEHFSAIQDVDTTDVPPADDVSGLRNVSREDKAAQSALCTPQQLLEKAPAVHDGQVQVYAVFEE